MSTTSCGGTKLWIAGLTLAIGLVGITRSATAQPLTYSNNNSGITIPSSGAASPYPSSITVAGFSGQIGRLTVTISHLSHTFPDDIDILLVGPAGQNLLLISDCGGSVDVNNITLTFADDAPIDLPDAALLTTGMFRPTNFGGGDTFPAPAPAPSGATTLSAFNGTNPNGTWHLYVVDDLGGDLGSIAAGWSLSITPVATSFSGGAVTINVSGVATPYPSNVVVSGMTGQVLKATLTLNTLSHTFPDDVDILLVGPGGQNAIVMSDVGGSIDATGITITLDDAAASPLPDAGPLVSGTFKPTNVGAGDAFPVPAPAPSGGSALASFYGANPNGTWSLYVFDDVGGDAGTIASWTLNLITGTPFSSGSVIITEFRVRGPNGANDEFVELYNPSVSPLTVFSYDGSSGWAVAASDGVDRFVIPNDTVIPGRGHYLGTNSIAYSIGTYPAAYGNTAAGNTTYAVDIPDNAGIALFRTSTAANFTLANRLDAVGSTSEANTLYKEGAGYPALTPFSIDYSFYRDLAATGFPKDTGSNSADFLFVDTNGTSAGAGQRLGTPGPENLSSPIASGTGLTVAWADPLVGVTLAPNRVRDFTSDPANNSTFGTITFRHRFTNTTGVPVTRLRFCIVNLSTFPSPFGVADLRPRDVATTNVNITGVGSVSVLGTTLEQPPSQPNGGGFNSSLSVGAVTSAAPVANGASIYVGFRMGIQQAGTFQLWLIAEALPMGGTAVIQIAGNTDANMAPTISNITNQTTNPNLPTPPIAFTVGDTETAPGNLIVSGTSSNTTLVPNANIVFGGSGANRTVTVTPAPNLIGTSTITVLVSDGAGSTGDMFVLSVVNTSPTVTISAPTSSPSTTSTTPFIALGGSAVDVDGTVSAVTWVSDRGPSGTATGTTSWSVGEVPVFAGANVLTVTATDNNGAVSTDVLTVNVSSFVYSMAEGATGSFFDLEILITNPNGVAAPVTVTFLKPDGSTVVQNYTIGATTRATILVDAVPGVESTAVSTVVTSTSALPLVVERTLRWDATGYGSHTEKATPGNNLTWYFAEGFQGGTFDTYLLLANPNAGANQATVQFLPEVGAPFTRVYDLPPTSRVNVYAGLIPELVGSSFGMVVTFTQPGVAERALYFGTPLFSGGHNSAGVNQPATSWFHAEGATGSYLDTYILMANPTGSLANVVMVFLPDTGIPITRNKTIPANSRLTVNVELEDPALANAAVATQITSDQPIISERSMFWPGPVSTWFEAHNSFGVTATATKWGLAEGRVGGAPAFETYILLANPGGVAANVTVTFMRSNGTQVVKNYTVAPTSRFNIAVNSMVPELLNEHFGAVITSNVPIAVERAMYSNASGVVWAAGTNATATRLP